MRLCGAATVALALVCALPAFVASGALSADVDGVRVELTSEPEKPRAARATSYRLQLSNPDGSGVTGARVTLQGRMADGMTVVAPLRAEPEAGVYRGRVLFTMEGRWELTLRIASDNRRFELPLTEHVER